MKCPNCNETLLMSFRNNIEIDYCPNCRGVWLDKGELDKFLEQANQQFPPNFQSSQIPSATGNFDSRPQSHHQNPYKKNKSFLNDFFDFD